MPLIINVSEGTMNRLRIEAGQRGHSEQTLATALVAIVARDDLFNAVLEDVRLDRYRPRRRESGLAPRAEEVLSYLTGLGPVGNEVHVRLVDMRKDLGGLAKSQLSHYLTALVNAGYIRREVMGQGRGGGGMAAFTVLERLEAA